MAAEFSLRLLGELPLDIHIREEADGGRPSVVAAPDSPRALAYANVARNAAGTLAVLSKDRSSVFPKIVVEES
jgi:ATP-binding protein involved in chromosome partitioning